MTANRFYEVASKDENEYFLYKGDKKKLLPSRTGFMQANVPCDVITPLIENGLLEEPLIKTNTDDCMWINDMSWWFIRDFEISQELYDNEEVILFIEMLDYNADIIINGRPVAKHKNTFRAFRDDVKRFLVVGKNQVIIRLTTGYEEYYPNDSLTYYCNSKFGQRVYLRKPQFTHGWDWCKPVPTCGIGGEIYMEGISGANISFFRCDTLEIKDNAAKLNFYFEIENISMCTADETILHVELFHKDSIVHKFDKNLYIGGGINFINEEVIIDSPLLWWPNGYGDQPLYTVSAYVECRGIHRDMKAKKIGIRTISINQDKMNDGSRRFDFIVNGTKVFCKGGNWVPADSVYLRITEEKYKILVKEAVECNFNMLRIWGGGLYEPDCFYDFCSEYGILVMQDFMYACAFYPDYLDWFMHEAALEGEYQTKRLAHQACMAVWTGNNEVHESYTDWFKGVLAPEHYYGTKIFNYLLPSIVKNNSPQIPYMPSSPFYGDKANDMLAGDCHMWSWTRQPHETGFAFMYELEAFDRLAAKVRFSSEYGFYGALQYSSIEKLHDGEEIKIGSKIWNHHGEHESKHNLILGSLSKHLIDGASLNEKNYILYSGILQGILYEELTLALRRHEHCSGMLIWMYNDCWPETGWTVIDYYTTRKISFYYLKRSLETQKFIIRNIDDQVSMTSINETSNRRNITVEHGYMDFLGNKSDVNTENITIEPYDRHNFNTYPVKHDISKGFYYMLEKGSSDFQPATSLRGYYREIQFPNASINVIHSEIINGNLKLTLCSDAFVPVVNIKLGDDTIKLSDNYFQLIPNVEKTIVIYNSVEQPIIDTVLF